MDQTQKNNPDEQSKDIQEEAEQEASGAEEDPNASGEKEPESDPPPRDDAENPYELTILGDSIGVGLVSDTSAGSPIPAGSPVSDLINVALGGGDITQAVFDLDQTYKNDYHNAFTHEISLDPYDDIDNCYAASCLLGIKRADMSNLSFSGAKFSDFSTKDIPNSRQVIIELGSNDFCSNTYVLGEVLSHAEKTIAAALALPGLENLVILAVPNIPFVFYEVAPSTEQSTSVPFLGSLTCGDVRDGKFEKAKPMCPRMVDSAGESAARQLEYAALNSAIQSHIESLEDTRITFVASIATLDFSIDELAFDCFHPGASLHNKISQQFISHMLEPK